MTVLRTKAGQVSVVERKSWPLAGLNGSGWQTAVPVMSADMIDSAIGRVTFTDLYRQQPWVAIVVNKLSRGIARLPLKTYRFTNANGDRERARDHPLAGLLKAPYPRGSTYQLVESIIGNLCIYGNALVVKYRDGAGSAPSELWPVPWRCVNVVAGKTAPVDRYEYNGSAGRRFFEPADVVHFRWWSPDGETGVSPLEPLRRTLAIEDAAQRYGASSFQHGARPSGALISGPPLNDQKKAALAASIKSATQGPDRAFGMLLLDGGLDWKPFAHTAVEAEVIQQRKLNREEVAAVFDIDPTQIGILDRATFANVTEAHLSLYMDTYGPPITMFEETLEAQLIRGEPAFEDVFCEFDLSDVLKGDIATRFDAMAKAIGGPWMTPNEGRKLENLPAIDDRGADSIARPLNMVALDGRIPSNSSTPVGTPPLKELLLAALQNVELAEHTAGGNGNGHVLTP